MIDIEESYKRIKEKQKELRSKYSDEEYIQRLEDALLCVEHIAMHEEELPDNLKTDKEKSLHSAINKIYRIVHIARLPGCFDAHDNWENELQEFIPIAKS